MSPDPSLNLRFKSHPWHGVAIGPEAPRRVIRRSQADSAARFAQALGALAGRG